MNVSQKLDDVKAFLEGDPLVQAAVNLVVPEGSRQFLADVVNGLAAELARTNQAAADQARADAVAAADPGAVEPYP